MKSNYVCILFFLFVFISGCMSYHYGEAEKEDAQEFIGLEKAEVLVRLGAPDNTLIINKKIFWIYFIRDNIYVLGLGERGTEHQMVLEFSAEADKVASIHYIEKGKSNSSLLFRPIK